MDTAPLIRDHVLPVGGQTTRHCQPWILYLSDEITYCLWVDSQRDTVSDGYCTSQITSHTLCGWTDNETLSAMDTAPLDEITYCLWVDRRRDTCQRWILHLSDGITYQLGVDRQRDTVSDGYYTSHTRSRTNCRWTANETLLAMDTTPLRQHHVLSVGGQTTRHCQSWILHLSDETTYELWVD